MKDQRNGRALIVLLLCSALLISFSLLSGCKGSTGSAGSTTGSISGIVTAASTTAPLAGVTVSTNPNGGTATTDASGNYSMSLPAGTYTVTFAMPGYTSSTATVNVAVGLTSPMNAAMATAASGRPSVTLVASGQDVGYNTPVALTATATSPKGGATLSYSWSGGAAAGTPTSTGTATTPSLTKALGGTAAPSTDPGGYISAYPQEKRIGVLPITTDSRGTISPSVTVGDGLGGSTKVSVSVNAAGLQPGLGNVAVGVPVYLNSGNTSTTTAWTVVGPSSSATYSVSTAIGTGRNPSFTPDVQGKYVVTATPGGTLNIYAGKWVGVIDSSKSSNSDVYISKTVTTANSVWYGWAPSSTSSSFTYTNWPVINTDPACDFCHNDTTAPAVASKWKQTVHASFFSRGIENITSNGGTCLTCHTTGYDLAASAANDGFDDMAALESFTYPTKAIGAWARMIANDPKTARRANIQCENCHGPQDTGTTDQSHARIGGNIVSDLSPSSVRVNYGAEVCAQCHASGTGHHFYSEWLASINPDSGMGHSKLGQIDATGYSGHARSTDPSCVRCHTGQGFAAYVDQLAGGNPGPLPASVITWSQANAEVQTCTACHDPHSDVNDNQLRASNSSMTMAGFSVDGVGKGALCMICHNNRNGIQCASAPTTTGLCTGGTLDPNGATFLHEDNDTYAPKLLDSMHDASQADVLMGRNFFFMGNSLPMISKHANVEDTCVGCHMALNPQTHLSHGALAVSSHVFYIKDADVPTLCANCHGNGTVDGEALQTFVEDQLAVLAQKIAANMLTHLTGTTVYVNTSSNTVHTPVANATSVDYWDGSFCINGTFAADGRTCSSGSIYKGSLTTITTDPVGTTPVITNPNDVLKRASWNWTMIERDGSKGIHNPSLITQVLNNTIAQFP